MFFVVADFSHAFYAAEDPMAEDDYDQFYKVDFFFGGGFRGGV